MDTRIWKPAVLTLAIGCGAFVSATPVTDGLQVWLDAGSGTSSTTDGAGLTSWTDAQNSHVFGNANVTLPTYVEDAGSGLPAIDFRRSSGFIGDFSSTSGPLLGDATIFVIGKFGGYTDHTPGSSSYWFSIDSSTGQAEHALGRDESGGSPDALYHWRSQPLPPGFYGTNITEDPGGDFNYFTAVYRGGGASGSGMAAWINGSSGLASVADLSTAGNDAAYGANPATTRVGLWTSNVNGLDGQIRELLIYDRILTPTEVTDVETYLAGRVEGSPIVVPEPEEFVFYANLSGEPNDTVPGFVPHGDPEVSGLATLTIRDNNTMDYEITLTDDRYRVTQAHLYNINKTSGTSGNPAHGDSIICWGGRWESNAAGGDSSEFLTGHGYSNGRLDEVLANPQDWALILHTEGGHFALDETDGLIEYDPNLSGPQETSVTGVPQSERARRFNNRVGKTLLDLVLREDNTSDTAAPFHDPNAPGNQNDSPFPDANGNLWVESDGNGSFQLTAEAVSRGYDLETEYLFYLYDDQGPSWDFGGPEGAMAAFLLPPLPGDYNVDGEVDAADYTTWRNNLGAPAGTLPNDTDGGPIGAAQYATWKANFGTTTTGSAAQQVGAVPEPTSLWLGAIGLCVGLLGCRRATVRCHR